MKKGDKVSYKGKKALIISDGAALDSEGELIHLEPNEFEIALEDGTKIAKAEELEQHQKTS